MSAPGDDRPVGELISEAFTKCEHCGKWYPSTSGHTCPDEPVGKRNKGEREERIEAMEQSEYYEPEAPVLLKSTKRRGAYHRPADDEMADDALDVIEGGKTTKSVHDFNDGTPICLSIVRRPGRGWAAATMADAHEVGYYPCGHCWSDLDD